ncbi:Protein of unknown function [Pyronema omphalodes CBS 100304]|uniref:Uncharacterized protein n=1 Tax=Pyronema omphalodes (strain CBS 100304) TaxID=1076935 RepID=U4KX05_PYROM|nr:Protein of unknown function [Pyronema omphalodes CBS 100304]
MYPHLLLILSLALSISATEASIRTPSLPLLQTRSLIARQAGSCPVGNKPCRQFCIPSTGQCCPWGGYCPLGTFCDAPTAGETGEPGCCEVGKDCNRGGGVPPDPSSSPAPAPTTKSSEPTTSKPTTSDKPTDKPEPTMTVTESKPVPTETETKTETETDTEKPPPTSSCPSSTDETETSTPTPTSSCSIPESTSPTSSIPPSTSPVPTGGPTPSGNGTIPSSPPLPSFSTGGAVGNVVPIPMAVAVVVGVVGGLWFSCGGYGLVRGKGL